MKHDFAALAHIALAPGATVAQADLSPPRATLKDAALDVMTDFRRVPAVTTSPDQSIDDALQKMKSAGVRLLLVVDAGGDVLGLITARDIQGERPVQLGRATGVPRCEITVAQMMTPQSAIEVLGLGRVSQAQVGHVLATLHEMERQHALVVDVDPDSGEHQVRGVFSTSEIGRRLGQDVSELHVAAHSLAEIHSELANTS